MRARSIPVLGICAAILTAIVLTACASPEPAPVKKHIGLVQYVEALDREKIEILVHTFVNKARERRKLSVLGLNSSLSDIARKHSIDMVTRGYFSHNTPEGLDFSRRYEQAGLDCSIREGNTIYGGAENIASTYVFSERRISSTSTQYGWRNERDIAKEIVNGWMSSPGHRRNILAPYWKTQGIGIFIKKNGEVLATQNFC